MLKGTVFIIAFVALFTATAMAAPSLLVTKAPVEPSPPRAGDAPSGPDEDPCALEGQWCQDGVRPYEFYDNKVGDGGSPGDGSVFGGTNTIYGKVTQITWDDAKITAFTITATISNPNTDPSGAWRAGQNDHYPETLNTEEYYKGTLYDTVLTADFAVRQDPSTLEWIVPTSWTGPYTNRSPKIYATNEDMGAWYCWNPELGPEDVADGNYYVPTWDFGDIEPGHSTTRDLEFGVAGIGMGSSDTRYDAIMYSYLSAPNWGDILLNRSTSLKISDWIEELCWDEGTAYPTDTWDPVTDPNGRVLYDPGNNSDVGVFHNIPEPATISLLMLGVLGLVRGRRR